MRRTATILVILLFLCAPISVLAPGPARTHEVLVEKGGWDHDNDEVPKTSRGEGSPSIQLFTEYFEDGLSNNWTTGGSVEINSEAYNEPSPENSANLDGDGDTLTSKEVNLDEYGFGFIFYLVQVTGSGDEPEVEDKLSFEMRLSTGWQHFQVHETGPMVSDMHFTPINISLPASAFHAGFQIQFSTASGSGTNQDDWYVDNVELSVKKGVAHFHDSFPANSIDAQKWPVTQGSPLVNTNAQNIPSPLYAVNLDGSGDAIESRTIDLSRFNEGYIYFLYQTGDNSTGDRDDPEIEDRLFIEYYADNHEWKILISLFGEWPSLNQFQAFCFPFMLQDNAFHTDFRFRLSTDAGDNDLDDWFIDEVGIITAQYYTEVFHQSFDDGILDNTQWPATTGTPIVNTDAANEPSGTYSINLDGSGDTVESRMVSLAGAQWATVSYWYEQGGGGNGDEPEAGDDLTVEYHAGAGWKKMKTHHGDEPRSSVFFMEEIPLPDNARSGQFKIRFTTIFGEGANKDDWFIDEVKITKGHSPNPGCFVELFEEDYLNAGDWKTLRGNPNINDDAQNEPSGTRSLNLRGEMDMVSTNGFNLKGGPSSVLSFEWWQGNGNGDANEPDNGDDLLVDILLYSGWMTVFRARGSAGLKQLFTNFSFVLPHTALHSNFKVRFRVTSNEGANHDDWFIDNVTIQQRFTPHSLKIGLYCEYSNKAEEGINPIKALSEVNDSYQLYLYENYMSAAQNLSFLDVFIISEQERLGEERAREIHDSWNGSLESFLAIPNRKIIVLDGGDGASRLLVNSFITSSGVEKTFGEIDIAMPEHDICAGLPNSFSTTSNAYFEDVNGRKVMTITVDNVAHPVVVEKRYARGSVLLFGFDYSEWSSHTRDLLCNTVYWDIINNISISPAMINDSEVFTGSRPYTVSVEVTDTIGPDDVDWVKLLLEEVNITISYEDGAPVLMGDVNDTVSIDSWYVEEGDESLKLHFNLSFDWSFPALESISINVSTTGKYLPLLPTNVNRSMFSVVNSVAFSGGLEVHDANNETVQADGIVGAGKELTFSGISVVYNGTDDKYPANDQFDVELWLENESVATDTDSSGELISITTAVPRNATENIIYELRITGPVTLNSDPRQSISLRIDNSSPVLVGPIPGESEKWYRDSVIDCSVSVNDTGLAGLGIDNIICRVSLDDGDTWNESQPDSFENSVAVRTVTFAEGKDNLLMWMASDSVGNGPVMSEEFNVWVDSEDVMFLNFLPTGPQNTFAPNCSIMIIDNTSGVTRDEVFVRQSSDGGLTWDDWDDTNVEPIDANTVRASFVPSFLEGDVNRIQWKASDIAGNSMISSTYTVEVDTSGSTPPEIRLKTPIDGATTRLKPELSWELLGGMRPNVTYKLFLAKAVDIDTSLDEHLITETSNTSFVFEGDLENGTKYYWTIIPSRWTGEELLKGTCVDGIWSFTPVKGAILELKLRSPTDSSTTDLLPTLKWNFLGDQPRNLTFNVYIGTTKSLDTDSNISLAGTVTNHSYTPRENLTNDTLYYWTVMPVVENGNRTKVGTCLSGVWSFRTDEGFKEILSFSIEVKLKGDSNEFHPGDTVNISISVNNSGNNPDIYIIVIDKNYTVNNLEDLEVPSKSGNNLIISIKLPEWLEVGSLTITLNVTSSANGIGKERAVDLFILSGTGKPADPDNVTDGDGGFLSNIPMPYLAAGLALVVIIIIIIIVIIVRRRRDDDWDDEDEDDEDYDDDEDEDDEDEMFSRIRKEAGEGAAPVVTTMMDDGAPMVNCTGCSKPISSKVIFCPHCGSKQEKEALPAAGSHPALPRAATSPIGSREDEGAMSLSALMERASLLIEAEKKEEGDLLALPPAREEISETEASPAVEQAMEAPPDEGGKKLEIDEITSVDQLLDMATLDSESIDLEEDIKVAPPTPPAGKEDIPAPVPRRAPAPPEPKAPEEPGPMEDAALTLEDVMREIVSEEEEEKEDEDEEKQLAPPEEDAPRGYAPPPPPPE